MSLLDELDKQRISGRPICGDRRKIARIDRTNPLHLTKYRIWFAVTSKIFSDNILEWRCEKLFNELQNIPAIENISRVFIYKNSEIHVGINPDVRSGYAAIHLFWTIMTMFEHCLRFDVNSLRIYWFDDAFRRTYFRKTAISDIVKQIKFRRGSDSKVYSSDSLARVVEMLVGRPVSYLEHTDNMYRMAKWYIKTTDNFKALREHFSERPV